jgi:hypothetical protein
MTDHAATLPTPADPVAGPGDALAGMLNIFIDPAATARRITKRLFWLYPLIVITVMVIVQQIVMAPYSMQVQRKVLQDRGVSAEQINTQLGMMSKFAFIGYIIAPILLVGMFALSAWLISVAASIVDVRTRFRYLFSLVSVCGMFYVVQTIAGLIVLKTKAPEDVQSRLDLQPPFGLDIFIHDVPKALQGILAFLNVFEIWSIVMLALTFAALTGASKGKSFFATSPLWLLGLVFAVLGSLLAPG